MRTMLAPVLALLAAIIASGMARYRMPPMLDEQKAERTIHSLPSPELARFLSLGYRTLAADYYWLRAVQYFGSGWNSALFYRDLFPFVNLVTELDPRWEYPLLFGGVALPTNLGRETWINTAESTYLLERGIRLFPDSVDFYVFAAYNLINYHHDHQRAAKYLIACSQLPKCPAYVPQLATRVLAAAGDIDLALEFARSMLESNREPAFVEMIEERVRRLELERDIMRLNDAVERFRGRLGRAPLHLSELVDHGYLIELPIEAYGGDFVLDAVSGTVNSSTHPERLRPATVSRPPQYE